MRLTAELAGKVESLYRESLEREFGNSLIFDPILVEPTENSEGEETFRVTIVYAGNRGRPQPQENCGGSYLHDGPYGGTGAPSSPHRVLRPEIRIPASVGAPD